MLHTPLTLKLPNVQEIYTVVSRDSNLIGSLGLFELEVLKLGSNLSHSN